MIRLSLAGVLAALAAPLAAQTCLTAADLASGIRVTFANGDITTARDLGAGIHEVEEIFAGGSQHIRFHAAHGTYFFWWAPLRGGAEMPDQATRVDWGMPVTDLPRPAADAAEFETAIATFDAQDSPVDTATRTIRFGAADPLALGGCRYEAVQVGMRTIWSDGTGDVDIWTYLPEIGLSFLTGWTDSDGNYQETTVAGMARM